ncbi:heparan sulfate glucosamine 3-O-sulfotransferase 1-like [Amphiura filiformis]|uniref:heparan sulfate glucosamine 3-O-sulfotransferase 1-like n=1 Tax=Amphiura filiformis TaxID=82378 RepID=UPI003B211A44
MHGITSVIPAGIFKSKSLLYFSTFLLFVTVIGVLHLSSNTTSFSVFSIGSRGGGVEQGCYRYKTASDQRLLPAEQLKERHCNQSFPDAIIIGTKKSGTTALRNFLTFHPQISTSKTEAHFFESRYYLGIDWYFSLMPYATPDQIIMEKTPRYFVHPLSPRAIRTHLGQDKKFILILRDPVQRAISDFTHVFFTTSTKEEEDQQRQFDLDTPRMSNAILRRTVDALKATLTDEQKTVRSYVKKLENQVMKKSWVADTFENTVLFRNGSVNSENSIIDTGIYVKYMKKWLAVFPREQFLVIDGEEFVYNPLPSLQKVESFLNISNFFTHDTFYFDFRKKFFCLAQPFRSCMNEAKGRTHPLVEQDVLDTLRKFYRPYNLELMKLLNLNFSWLTAT